MNNDATTYRKEPRDEVRTLVVVILSLCGCLVCGAMLMERDGGWRARAYDNGPMLLPGDGGCGWQFTGTLGCQEVVASRWGSFDFYLTGRRILVPTSFLGLAYFAWAALWFGILGPPGRRPPWCAKLTAMCLLTGGAASIGLVLLMAIHVRSWCSGCVYAHAINLLMIAATQPLCRRQSAVTPGAGFTMAHKPPQTVLGGRAREPIGVLVAVSVMVVALWLYYDAATMARKYWRESQRLSSMTADLQSDERLIAYWLRTLPVRVAGGAVVDYVPSLSHEPIDPRVNIFTSLDDPRANCFDAWMTRQASGMLQDFTVEWHVLPAIRERKVQSQAPSAAGNTRDSMTTWLNGNPGPTDELAAYHATTEQGGVRAAAQLRKLLRKPLSERRILQFAAVARLNPDRLSVDIQSEGVRRRIQRDVALAQELSVHETPTVFVSGVRVPAVFVGSELFWQSLADIRTREQSCDTGSHTQTSSSE